MPRMQTAADAVRNDLARAMAGSEDTVLLEKPLSASLFTGYTRLYLPVAVKAPGAAAGQILPVRLLDWDGERTRAEAL